MNGERLNELEKLCYLDFHQDIYRSYWKCVGIEGGSVELLFGINAITKANNRNKK